MSTLALHALRESVREPFFLWVHYFDPHDAYVRHPEFDFVTAESAPARLTNEELFRAIPALRSELLPDPFSVETVNAIYAEEIAFTDAAIGRLVDGIAGMDLDRAVVTALTADHGEYFMERGRFGHGQDVYDELIHVPLIIAGDIGEMLQGVRFPDVVEIAGLARTMADLAQVEHNPFGGENLLALDGRKPRPAFSYGCYAWGDDRRKFMVELDGWKLIRNLDDDRFELYDLARDPEERDNRWASATGTAEVAREALLAALDDVVGREGRSAPTIDLRPEEIEQLESLGYTR